MATRKRLDPPSRPADGYRAFDKIAGKSPDRHYVLTDPNNLDTGTPYYTDILGYDVETVRPGGPRAAVGKSARDGTEVRSGGMVLVSCPIEQHQQRFVEGQELANEFDRRALRDGNIDDPMRGRGYRFQTHVSQGFASEEDV